MASFRNAPGARLVLLSAVLAFAGCGETPTPEFVSKQDKFKVRFGREPKRTENVGLTHSTVYSVEQPKGVLRVTITKLPIPDDDPPERVPEYLNLAKDDLIRASHGQVIFDKSVALAGKYPGREFAARLGGSEPGILHARIYLVGKRLYQVMVVGTEEFANAEAAAFLDSFMVLS
jgi:hypothetical protein